MKTFEKIILWLLALVLAFSLPLSLVACGNEQPAETGEQMNGENNEEPADDAAERIGTVSLADCVIVTAGSPTVAETRTAGMLQKQIYATKGVKLTVCKSTSIIAKNAKGKIVIGPSVCQKAKPEGEHGFAIAGNGNTFEIAANSSYGYEAALNYLTRNVITQSKTMQIDDTVERTGQGTTLLTAQQTHAGEVRFMVNNVYGYGSDKPMRQRMKMLLDLYTTYSPDVIGLQEYHDNPRSILHPLLTDAGYTEVKGAGMTNGASTPLYYKADVLDLLDCGYLLYTDAQDLDSPAYQTILGSYTMAQVKVNDDSKSITWGIFRVRETGHVFLAAATHLFYLRDTNVGNDPRDGIWRRVQAAVAKETVFAAADAYLTREGLETGTMPIFIGGDINSVVDASAYTTLQGNSASSSGNYTGANAMTNTNILVPSKERIKYSTNHHHEGNWDETYEVFDEPYVAARSAAYESSLDYIFVNSFAVRDARVDVKYSAALFDLFAMLATDHCPVMIDFNLTGAGDDAQ